MKRLGRALLFLSVILWTVAIVSTFTQTARAEIDGNCEAKLKGVDVRPLDSGSAGDAIDVENDEVVAVDFTSSAGFASHKIDLEFAGQRVTVSDQTDGGDTTFSDSVNVDDYAFWGVGLYKVIGEATLNDGSKCSGAALVNVKGNPLTTVAGGVAAAATAVGAVGVLGAGIAAAMDGPRASRQVEEAAAPLGPPSSVIGKVERGGRTDAQMAREFDFRRAFPKGCVGAALPALLLTGAALAMPGGQPSTPGVRLERVSWRPRLRVSGLLGGLLGGAGIAVLLQQYAVAPLTRSLAIEGLVIGVAVGLVVPSLAQVWSILQVNGAIARVERRLNAALDEEGPPPPEGGQVPPPESGPEVPPEGPPEEPQT